jgi:carbon-monoxide dehydrogenase medium subunit
MIPGSFDYHAPTTVEEAIGLLARHGAGAKLLAGGHSLIPAMRFRLAQPETLIDLNRIPGLDALREDGGNLVIGALTREVTIEDSDLVRRRYPLLADTSAVVADPLVRNRGTVGGNLAHADPANDHPAAMLAYGAELIAQGPAGRRTIAIDDFFTEFFESALAADEVLIEIRVPSPGKGAGGAYLKLERKVGDYAISAVAVQLVMDGKTCREARIGLTNVNPVPMRATGAEAAVAGKELTDQVLEAAGKAAAAQCDPSTDLRGGVDYKRDVTRVLTKRALRKAAERARGGAA